MLRIGSGDACPNCGVLVAPDQRYCVECGERRGEPRLPFMDGRKPATPATTVVTPAYPTSVFPPAAQPRGKWSSGVAFLATVALLLLAMGVGVMIGNNGDDGKALAQQPLIIGGAATSPTGATGTTSETASASKADAATTEKAGVDADAVAKKNGVKLAPKDVDLGGKCAKDSVGCDDSGEFTGDYFK